MVITDFIDNKMVEMDSSIMYSFNVLFTISWIFKFMYISGVVLVLSLVVSFAFTDCVLGSECGSIIWLLQRFTVNCSNWKGN